MVLHPEYFRSSIDFNTLSSPLWFKLPCCLSWNSFTIAPFLTSSLLFPQTRHFKGVNHIWLPKTLLQGLPTVIKIKALIPELDLLCTCLCSPLTSDTDQSFCSHCNPAFSPPFCPLSSQNSFLPKGLWLLCFFQESSFSKSVHHKF